MYDQLITSLEDADYTNYPFHISLLGTDRMDNTEDAYPEAYSIYRKNWSVFPEQKIVGDYPLCLDIEPAFNCNLRCKMCYIHDIPNYGKGPRAEQLISSNLVFRIIDEAADGGVPSIKFTGRGEPLLNPQLPDLIRYAKKKGIMDVMFNTNATLLNGDMSRKIIDAGLDKLIVSMDGTVPETYNEIRVGGQYEQVVRNVEDFVKIRNKAGAKLPSVRLQMVCMEDTKDQVLLFVKFWKDVANRINLIRYKPFRDPEKDKQILYSGNMTKVPCRQLWQRLFITAAGKVHMCCADYRGDAVLGDLGAFQTIHQLWHSDKLNEIRALHNKKRFDKLPLCQACPSNLEGDFWAWMNNGKKTGGISA